MTEAKEIIVLILGWLTGVGVTLAGVLLPNLQAYLLPTGIAIMLATLGLDIGFNFIPHAKLAVAEKKLQLEKLSLDTQPIDSKPENATIVKNIEVAPGLKEAVGDLFKAILREKEPEVLEESEAFPLSSQ